MALQPTIDPFIRRDDALLCGRLVSLPSTVSSLRTTTDPALRNALSIDFPAMPDVLELMRSAEYKVLTNVVLPDGVHQYMRTNVLEIPFSFSLHADDSAYCKQGALTLIQLAARLHSFILPIGKGDATTGVLAKAGGSSDRVLNTDGLPVGSGTSNTPAAQAPSNATDAGTQENGAVLSAADSQTAFTGSHTVYNPVTCWLHLMFISDEQPGISCVGYVKEVGAKLKGPWRRGPLGSFNLPTSGDFSFVFVHRPGHGNSNFAQQRLPDNINLQPQAYANIVKDRFYNTRNLIVAANYQGLSEQ